MIPKRLIYKEGTETVLVNFRVPKDEKKQFVEDVRKLLWRYDVRNTEKDMMMLAPLTMDDFPKEVREMVLKPVKNYFGGSIVKKEVSECFIVDKFQNLLRDNVFDDFYVRDQGDMVHFTNPEDAQRFMKENNIK